MIRPSSIFDRVTCQHRERFAWWWLGVMPCLLAAVFGSAPIRRAAASEPAVVRIRVPAKEVSRYFAPGTELQVMSRDGFESLLDAARTGAAALARGDEPRLIRARHRAHWDGKVLKGHTDLVINSGGNGPADFVLSPWTPAILDQPEGSRLVGARDTGRVSLWIDQTGAQSVALDWELRARDYPHGKGFRLQLPAEETTSLTLDVPADWVPSSRAGRRHGPRPAPEANRDRWEIEAEAGRIDVHLYDPDRSGERYVAATAWISGATEVDLRRGPDRERGLANWIADYRVDLDPRNLQQLEIELDPGLELIDVRGSAARRYRARPSLSGTRVEISLEGPLSSGAELRLLAHVRVPEDGLWKIPAARPLNGVWTGGTTSVILDDLHVLESCRELGGRRVFPLLGGQAGSTRLDFESITAGSVAELGFRKQGGTASCVMRGQLYIGEAPARVEARVAWTPGERSAAELEIDLSPAWLVERVELVGANDPLNWHPSVLPAGGTRLHVSRPTSTLPQRELSLLIAASSTIPGGRGALALPRVRPVGARIGDEAWVAWVDGLTTIRPTVASGLAWIDPSTVPGLIDRSLAPVGFREALAWRWLEDRAEARVDRERIEQEPRGSVFTRVRIDSTGKGVSLEGRIVVTAGAEAVESVPFWLASEISVESWRFSGESGRVSVSPRTIDEPARTSLGFPAEGSVRSLAVRIPSYTEKEIRFRVDLPWSGSGPIPLLGLPRSYLPRGTILLECPPELEMRAQPVGLRRLDPSSVDDRPIGVPADPAASRKTSRSAEAHAAIEAFAYGEAGARLLLNTDRLMPVPSAGIVREALLTTSLDAGQASLNRLRLVVGIGQERSLVLGLSPRISLVRVQRDGSEVACSRSGPGIAIPLSGQTPGLSARTATVIVDYTVAGPQLSDGARMEPVIPSISLPCVSFVWEVVTPPAWKSIDPGAGFITVTRTAEQAWPLRALGLPQWVWRLPMRGNRVDGESAWAELDSKLEDAVSDQLTLAQWFTRWDAASWPVVVDRLALNAAGFGPRTVCTPRRVQGGRSGLAISTLARCGLALVRFPGAIVITTEGESAAIDPSGQLAAAIAEATFWGSDRTDRFQSLSRWRGELSPRTTVAGADEPGERPGLPPERIVTWYARPEWPDANSFVYIVDANARITRGWLIAAVTAIALCFCCPRIGRYWLPVGACLMVASIAIVGWIPSRAIGDPAGLFVGALLALVYELGRQAVKRGRREERSARPDSTLLRRAAVPAAIVLVAIFGLGGMTRPSAAGAGAGRDEPAIRVFFPFDGEFDPSRPGDRVILRLVDHERLVQLARGPLVRDRPLVRAIASSHRLSPRGPHEVEVNTELELDATGSGPFVWHFPVAEARDIVAIVDDVTVPIAIEAGGIRGSIAIATAGKHQVRITRGVRARIDAGRESLIVPVNPVPTARIVVDPGREANALAAVSTRGSIEAKADLSIPGRLGPADRIEITWPVTIQNSTARPPAAVEAQILWDILPAGDRVRARFTYDQPGEISAITIAHEPGLILRSTEMAGSSDAFWEKSARDDSWTLRIDPPLPGGSTIAVDCWRPAALPVEGAADAVARRLPRLQPRDVDRFAGSLGVRRPGDWSGRLEPLPGSEPISDEAFVKSWGKLPDLPLTLSGTSRFVRECQAELETGPTPARAQIRPSIDLRIENGRITLAIDAEVIELSGHVSEVIAELPPDVQVIQVVGDGLTDWVAAAGGRLALRFDRPGAGPGRKISIRGWIPVNEQPLRVGSILHRMRTPWVVWRGVEAVAGFLTISSVAKSEVRGADGLTLISSESTAAVGTAPARNRQTFRVENPLELGEILWEAVPSRVSVTIDSQLTVFPDAAEWVAVLRYDVIGGALDAIRLRMPADWAAVAERQLSGGDYQFSAERRGPSAFWSINLERPIWGAQRFVLRSTLPLPSDREIVFPEIVPLGRGAVDTAIRVVNASGRSLTSENHTGLQAMVDSGRFQGREFAVSAGPVANAFRVARDPWALRVQLPRQSEEAAGASSDSARVDEAEVLVSVSADGTLLGRGVYTTVPGPGRLVSVEMPPDCRLLWVSVDGAAARVSRSPRGNWSIPVDGRRVAHVGLLWEHRSRETGSRRWVVGLPRVGRGAATGLVTVLAPEGTRVTALPIGLERVPIARFELTRADRLARSVADHLARIDRSSGRDHERLIALLINHELALRNIERSLSFGGVAARVGVDAKVVAAARDDLVAIVKRAGFDDDLASSLRYLGRSETISSRPLVEVSEQGDTDRIRFFGVPTAFTGPLPGVDSQAEPIAIPLERTAADLWSDHAPAPLVTAVGMILSVVLGLAGLAIPTDFRRAANLTALVVALSLAATVGGPLLLLIAITLIAWARGRPMGA